MMSTRAFLLFCVSSYAATAQYASQSGEGNVTANILIIAKGQVKRATAKN